MLRRILSITLGLSLSIAIEGCQTAPPDIPLCIEINMSRGYCINTISATEFEVNDFNKLDDKTWWEARVSMILLPASSWAKLKTYIITQCKRTGACDKEITSWERTINTVDKTLENK